jgi:hypothetical protein
MPEGNNRARSITDGRDQAYRKVPQFSAHLLGDGYGYFAGLVLRNPPHSAMFDVTGPRRSRRYCMMPLRMRRIPDPLLTRNQVELMEIDTVSSPEMPGFVELGISPRSVEAMLQEMLPKYG